MNKKVLENLRGIVRKEVTQQLKEEIAGDKAVSVDKKVQMIVKVAGQGLKAVKLLRNLPDPTQRVRDAVEANVISLEHVFNHMLSAPMEYLDENPQDVVDTYRQTLDDKATALQDGATDPTMT